METFKNEIPNWILEDDSFLFHGSSNISEQELDKGNTLNFSFLPIETIDKIVITYKEMNWYGIHEGGFGVLSTFSSTDLYPTEGKYFYLGESPNRSALYATADFAGGELLRSIYYAIKDLFVYIEEPNVREKHKKEIDGRRYSPIHYEVNLEKLKAKADKFLPVFKEVESIRNSYQYGVLYCYKIEEKDYPKLKYRGGMGILAKETLSTDRLKAKIKLDNPDSYFGGFNHEDKLRNERVFTWMERLGKG